MKAAIIVDSTAGLSEDLVNEPNVFQLYLSSVFTDGTVFVDSPDEQKTADFYIRMNSEEELPKTSQPEPVQAFELFDKILEEGYDTVFGVFLSAEVSGTFQTVATVAAEYTDRLDIHLIDSQTTSFVLEAMTINLLKLIEKKTSSEDIVKKIENSLQQSAFYFTVTTLDNLVKGGRLSAVSGMIGNLLNIKPILSVTPKTEGHAKVSEKVRGKKKAINRLFEIATDYINQYSDHAYVTVGHTGAVEDAEILKNRLHAAYPQLEIRIGFITPVLGTHGGYGAVSINIAPLL